MTIKNCCSVVNKKQKGPGSLSSLGKSIIFVRPKVLEQKLVKKCCLNKGFKNKVFRTKTFRTKVFRTKAFITNVFRKKGF